MCGGGGYPARTIDQLTDEELQAYPNPGAAFPGRIDRGTDANSGDWARYYLNDQEVTSDAYQDAAGNYADAKSQFDEAQAILRQRQQQRDEIQRIANERQALVQRQQQDLLGMLQEQDRVESANREQVTRLQQQQAERLSGIELAGRAASTSLGILGSRPTAKAPTAATSRPTGQARGRRASASIRIGATTLNTGAGLNIGV
jgi:hypothetical protein